MSSTKQKLMLRQAVDICQTHITRLQFAAETITLHFPIDTQTFTGLTPQNIRDIDAIALGLTACVCPSKPIHN
jgi:hypothetical protein